MDEEVFSHGSSMNLFQVVQIIADEKHEHSQKKKKKSNSFSSCFTFEFKYNILLKKKKKFKLHGLQAANPACSPDKSWQCLHCLGLSLLGPCVHVHVRTLVCVGAAPWAVRGQAGCPHEAATTTGMPTRNFSTFLVSVWKWSITICSVAILQ